MQPIHAKSQRGIFSTDQSKIRIFSKERSIKVVAINASVYQRSTWVATPYGENEVDRD